MRGCGGTSFQILYDESVQQPWGLSIIVPGNNLFVFGLCLACELPLNFFFLPQIKKKKKKGKRAGKLALLVGREREKRECQLCCSMCC